MKGVEEDGVRNTMLVGRKREKKGRGREGREEFVMQRD